MRAKNIEFLLRVILGGTFIYASLGKIAFSKEFALVVSSYKIIPEAFVPTSSFILPWLELLLGISLLVGLEVKYTTYALIALLIMFILMITIKLANGTFENCGCFSLKQKKENPFLIIARDGILIIISCVILIIRRKTRGDNK